MSLAVVYSRSTAGIHAPQVFVEVHLSNGLPCLSIVGLPEAAVKESKDRVRGAILNSGYDFPSRRITVNLAPADIPKEGGRFDLPIALGILAASGQIAKSNLQDYEFAAELALSGELRPVRSILPAAIEISHAGRLFVLAPGNGQEAALVASDIVRVAASLSDVTSFLAGQVSLPAIVAVTSIYDVDSQPDLAEVRSQYTAKRALEIAAAGGHSMLMSGPPGTGKSMLAMRLPGLLPEMSRQQALETAAIHSLGSHGVDLSHWRQRPFRAPHHTASAAALVGGGSNPRPGEISLAHNGILFLDEIPEFGRHVLEVLREPMESGTITISRAARQAEFPARFQLVAAMNPCPCGYLGDPSSRCHCSEEQVNRYRAKLSGPLLDRIDLQVEVPAVAPELLLCQESEGESSAQVRQRVSGAQERQYRRAGKLNCSLSGQQLQRDCDVETSALDFLQTSLQSLDLSARSLHRVLRVSRTIADLQECRTVQQHHIAEALMYRGVEDHLKKRI